VRSQGTIEYLLSIGEVLIFALIVAGAVIGTGLLVSSFAESEKPVLWKVVP